MTQEHREAAVWYPNLFLSRQEVSAPATFPVFSGSLNKTKVEKHHLTAVLKLSGIRTSCPI